MRSTAKANSMACSSAESLLMTASSETGAPFTAAMVQMRTAMLPETSLEQGIALIRKAKSKGADYVQTPEVTNIIQQNRKALFELLANDEDDRSLKAYRELARELKIHLHIGSIAVRDARERAANRSFLIAPDGGILASYDNSYVRHRTRRRRELSQSPPTISLARPPSSPTCPGARWTDHLLRRPLSGAVSCARGSWRILIAVPSAFTVRTGEAHWSTLLRARAIEKRLLHLCSRAGGQARKRARNLWPFADRRSMGRNPCGRQQHRHRRRARENRSGEGAGGTQEYSIPAARPPLRPQGPRKAARTICISCEDRHDPLFAAL